MARIVIGLVASGDRERCERILARLSEHLHVAPAAADSGLFAEVTVDSDDRSKARKMVERAADDADPRWRRVLSLMDARRVLNAEQAVEAGRRDAAKAIELTRKAPGSAPAVRWVSFEDRAAEGAAPGEDTTPEGAPLLAIATDDAFAAWLGGDTVFDAYANTFEIELQRAEIRRVLTISPPSAEDEDFLSLYLVDGDRFPMPNKKIVTEDGYVLEMSAQSAFGPPKRRWVPWRR